jgi:hypothetical protein
MGGGGYLVIIVVHAMSHTTFLGGLGSAVSNNCKTNSRKTPQQLSACADVILE